MMSAIMHALTWDPVAEYYEKIENNKILETICDIPFFEAKRIIDNFNKFWTNRALLIASLHGNYDLVRYLMTNDKIVIDINDADYTKKNPLIVACENNHEDIVKLLLYHGADPLRVCDNKYNAFYAAITHGHINLVRLMVNEKLIENDILNIGLIHSVIHDRISIALFILRLKIFIIINHNNLIETAIRNNRIQFVKLFLNIISNPFKEKYKIDFQKLLLEAIKIGSIKIIELLIRNGADPNIIYENKTYLIYSCIYKQLECVAFFLKYSYKNYIDASNNSALSYAIKAKNIAMCELLLKSGVSLREYYGNDTPMLIACDTNDIEICKLLIAAGASVINENILTGNTPLLVACVKNNKELVIILISAGAHLNHKNSKGRVILEFLCSLDIKKEIIALLIDSEANVNCESHDGNTPLLNACSSNNEELETLLIAAGADVNCSNNHGNTPLLNACSINNKELAALLIAAGADVNCSNHDGNTPLLNACDFRNKELITLLIAASADVNCANLRGITPLIKIKDHELIEILVAAGANVNYKTEKMSVLISSLRMKKSLEFVQKLIDLGANVNDKLEDGTTSLMVSVYDVEIYKILINNGALINEQDSSGQTALMHAVLHSQIDTIYAMINDSVDVTIKNKDGKTALDLAKRGAEYTEEKEDYLTYCRIIDILSNTIKNNCYKEQKKCVMCKQLSFNNLMIYLSHECPICCVSCDKIIAFECGHINCCTICFHKIS